MNASAKQLTFAGTGRKRARKPVSPLNPSLAALLTDRDRIEAESGRLGWQHEQTRRRTDLVARLRARRKRGYHAPGRLAA